ncbi:MAG TPA: Ig-like domain-containing protein, partial [Longimicrobium sp.]|nr:Ig-like domain-containing protein [Longimicrobium sp.]
RAWLLALPLAAACTDGAPSSPASPEPAAPPALLRVDCVGNRAALTVRCGDAAGAGGARGDLLLGGQGTYVRFASSGPNYADGSFTFFVTVQNLLGQAIGTTDGTNAAGTGVRAYFPEAPAVTSGTGAIAVVADGAATFTASGQPYYQYSQLIAPGAVSTPRRWRLDMPSTVNTFTFSVFVSAPVRYPDGWVDLGRDAATLGPGGTLALQPVVRDRFGRAIPGEAVTLSSSAPAVAALDSATVRGVAAGTATVTATSGARTGVLTVTVARRVASMLLFPFSGNVLTGNPQQLTTILRDSAGNNLSTTGRVVAYASGDTTRARVSATGLVTALSPGAVTITATAEGLSASSNLTVTTAAAGVVKLKQVSAGATHTCGLGLDGAAYCWGNNLEGQLGNGRSGTAASEYRNTPAAVSGGLRFASISAGAARNCAVTAEGAAYCWGNNVYGTLGKGDTAHALAPTAVSGGIAFAVVSMGREHTCGLSIAGDAYCWGRNSVGQLGNGGSGVDSSAVPVPVAGGHRFVSLSTAWDHTCAVDAGGAAYCWGSNERGSLGDGTRTHRNAPTAVRGGIAFASVSAGQYYSCGVSTGGTGYCWGDNSFSTLGN